MTAPIWAYMAEFPTPEALLAATQAARQAGYRHIEAHSPMPIEGLAEALDFKPRTIPIATFAGAVLGGAAGYFMQWYSAVVDYPVNIGGRPLHSWPMFIPVTFELVILGGALAAVLALFIGNGLPRLYHPVFGAPDFGLAMRNRFFLCLRADDPLFDREATAAWLDGLQPLRRSEVQP
jgi:hypothetical protein